MDLTALDTFLELKQGIGTHGNPHPDHVAQLDGYLKQSEHASRVRMGILTEGQFGARDVQKHLWKLPIPGYDPGTQLHVEIAQAGASAATAAAAQLAALRKVRGDRLTWTIVRRELRKWLRTSNEWKAVESAVARLLAGD